MTPSIETDLIKRNTVAQMIDAYETAKAEISKGYELLAQAEARLKATFEDRHGFDANPRDNWRTGPEATEEVMSKITRAAWRAVSEKMEYRRILSTKRLEEFDNQVEKGTLPPLTSENIFALAENMIQNFPAYIAEACAEVFEFLRPSHTWTGPYKTNESFQNELGERVILTWQVERWAYNGHPFRVRYHREQALRNLANVFQMLDGKGPVTTHYGPLVDAISTSETGTGETEYFAFKCFANGNLHLRMKRMDLVNELSAKASSHLLKKGAA